MVKQYLGEKKTPSFTPGVSLIHLLDDQRNFLQGDKHAPQSYHQPRQKLTVHVEIAPRETIPVLLEKSASGSLSWDNKILNDRHRGHRQG